jgi:predicted nucleotide-binding protein
MANQPAKQRKPRVFIGSSSEAKKKGLVEEFKKVLSKDAYMIPWWESPEFKPLKSIFSGLMGAVNTGVSTYDFSLFILTADDVLRTRGTESSTPRDNVLFELGLFLGAFGPDRTFAVIQKESEVGRKTKLPSDFGGIIIPPISTTNKARMKQSVREAADQFRRLIKEMGRRTLSEKLVDVTKYVSWEFDREEKAFKVDISQDFLRRRQNQNALKSKKLLLIAMQHDPGKNWGDNERIALSTPRMIPQFAQPIRLCAPTGRKNIFSDIPEGTEVEGYVLAMPASLEIKRSMVGEDFLKAGAEFAFGGAD